MKNFKNLKLVLIALCITLTGSVNAQDKDKDKPAKIGIRAGWNYASMFIDNSELEGIDNINSFYVGVFKEKRIVPMLRFGSGLEYFQNGYKLNGGANRELHYVSVPLYLKVKVGPIYATGGSGLNFKVSESLPGNALLDPLNNEKSKGFDMPLQLGVGLKVLFISGEIRYHWGMLDANGSAKNQYLQAGLTFSF